MNSLKLEEIITTKRLPKDELDRFWDNVFGFIPAVGFLMAGLGPLLASKTTVSSNVIWILLSIGVAILIYTVYAKLNERSLKFISTGLNRDENEKLIKTISKQEKWNKLTNKEYFHTFIFSFVKFHSGFKLTLIPINNGILINFRNRGTVQARMPYQFGIETLKQNKIENKINNYAQQKI